VDHIVAFLNAGIVLVVVLVIVLDPLIVDEEYVRKRL